MNFLNRADPMPLYIQLKDALQDQISHLKPGDQLPTEEEIENAYSVSRATIRAAFQALVLEGVVERIQGRGTFVAEPKISHVPRLTSFTENMRSQGFEPSRNVLESTVKAPPADVASRLEVADGTRCRYVRRILLADGAPVGVAETWLSNSVEESDERFAPENLEQGSLYELLRSSSVGLDLAEGVEIVRPELAGATTAGLLRCSASDPVLVCERLSYDSRGKPVEFTTLIFHGQRYQYRIPIT